MDSTLLSMEQFLFSMSFLLPLSFIFGSFSIDGLVKAIPAILYLGIVSSGIAYTLQVYAQSEVNVTIACIIMSLESVFSLVFGMFDVNLNSSMKQKRRDIQWFLQKEQYCLAVKI